MPGLVALDFGPSDAFVAALATVWAEDKAALPIDQQLPAPARRRLLETMKPTEIWSVGERTLLTGGVEVEAGDALVVVTSGTTGRPKGVVLTMAATRAAAIITSDALGASIDDDRWLLCLPVAHVGGLSIVTRSLVTGVPITTLPRYEQRAVEAAASRGATLVSLVPSVLNGLDTSAFRRILLGGSAVPQRRPPNSTATYGLTETGGGVVYDGLPLAGVELRIDDGEIMVRSPTTLRTYRLGEDPKIDNGWLPTGDLGKLSPDGELTVFGRRDDLIVSGGYNVFPGPVERVLRTHVLIADVAIVARPDDNWGSAVTAVVVPADPANPPTLDVVRGWAKTQLSPYAAPTRLELIDKLPKTATGKTIRRLL